MNEEGLLIPEHVTNLYPRNMNEQGLLIPKHVKNLHAKHRAPGATARYLAATYNGAIYNKVLSHTEVGNAKPVKPVPRKLEPVAEN